MTVAAIQTYSFLEKEARHEKMNASDNKKRLLLKFGESLKQCVLQLQEISSLRKEYGKYNVLPLEIKNLFDVEAGEEQKDSTQPPVSVEDNEIVEAKICQCVKLLFDMAIICESEKSTALKIITVAFSNGSDWPIIFLECIPMLKKETIQNVASVLVYLDRKCEELNSKERMFSKSSAAELCRAFCNIVDQNSISLQTAAVFRLLLSQKHFYHACLGKDLTIVAALVRNCIVKRNLMSFDYLRYLLEYNKTYFSSLLQVCPQQFFQLFLRLIRSDDPNLVARSTKLLGQLLLDERNVHVSKMFVGDVENLQTIVTLLHSQNKQINVEAFHIFKIFAANPNKTIGVNKYLSSHAAEIKYQVDCVIVNREQDKATIAEKRLILRVLSTLDRNN